VTRCGVLRRRITVSGKLPIHARMERVSGNAIWRRNTWRVLGRAGLLVEQADPLVAVSLLPVGVEHLGLRVPEPGHLVLEPGPVDLRAHLLLPNPSVVGLE